MSDAYDQMAMEQAFRSSRWPLYGLSQTATCRRFLGGWAPSGDLTETLELAHLPREGSREEQLRVEVRPMHPPQKDRKKNLARELWRQARLPLPPVEDADNVADNIDDVDSSDQSLPGMTWETMTLLVDRDPVTCHKAEEGDHWQAVFQRDAMLVVIRGHDWPSEEIQLVTIKDVEPYIQGHRNLFDRSGARRTHRRAGGH